MEDIKKRKDNFLFFDDAFQKIEKELGDLDSISNIPTSLEEKIKKIENVYLKENPDKKDSFTTKEILQYGINKNIVNVPLLVGNGMSFGFCGDSTLAMPGLTAGELTIKEIKEKERVNKKNAFLIKLLESINDKKIEEIDKENTIYINEDIKIDSEDEEQVIYLKSIYKKSLNYYKEIEELSTKINDYDFLNKINELQLITQNILLKFNENPFCISKHSMFVDYYQEKFVCFLKDYINMSTNTLSKEETMINEIKSIIINLKEVFIAEYNSITKPDMLDLAIEIDLMKKNINEYRQNIKEKTTNVPLKNNIEVQKEQRNNVSQLKNELTVQKKLPEKTKWYKNYGFYRAITIAGGLLFIYYFINK